MSGPTSTFTSARAATDASSDWKRTEILWIIRWPIVLLVSWICSHITDEHGAAIPLPQTSAILFFWVVVAGPFLETIFECLLPYSIIAGLRKSKPGAEFIVISAMLMTFLHIITLATVINAAITGAFIAYVYASAARRGQGSGFLHAISFHAAINLVGWILLIAHVAV